MKQCWAYSINCRWIILWLPVVLLLSCKKDEGNLNVKIFGHAGNGLGSSRSLYEGNSLESIEMALSIDGIDGVELDVQLSLDGTLWLFHDSDLESKTNGKGYIFESTDAYIGTLHYKTWHKEKLIRLKDIPVAWVHGKSVMLDLKNYYIHADETQLLEMVTSELKDFIQNVPNTEVSIVSNVKQWLNNFQSLNAKIYAQVLSLNEYQTFQIEMPTLDGLVVESAKISKEEVAVAQSDGSEVHLFNVRSSPGIKKAFGKTPDGVIVDDIRNAIIEKY